MAANDARLTKAGAYYIGLVTDDGPIERIELRTDGHGLSGYYDVIYLYVEGRDREWRAMPAHLTDFWEYE